MRFTARPAVLPSSGGVVALHVDGARSCRISARGVHVPKRACGSVRVHVAANPAAGARRLVFYVHAAHQTIKRVVVERAQPATKPSDGGAGDVAPAITLQPASITVPYGSPVTLAAAASGVPAPSLQWQVSANGGATWANTSATFTATAQMNGDSFRAVFTNAAGATTTNPISLTVDPVSTLNFSGYEDYAPAGAQFTSVRASWVVPSVSCAPSTYSYSAEWSGIGDQTSVEQDGTWSDCLDGTPFYSAWYEIYGDPDLNSGYAIPLSYPVSAGDQISASVTLVGTTWEFAMIDATHDWAFSTSVPSPPGVTLNQGSAEWIVEDPNGCSPNCETLAQFTPVTFSGASATETEAGGTISAFPAAADQIVSSDGSTVYAAPGPLSAAGDSFTDTWYAN